MTSATASYASPERSPSESGRSMRWERETIVGITASGWSVSSRNIVFGGGSSSVFRNEFADSSSILSAPTTTPTFHPPENAVADIGPTMPSRMDLTCMVRERPSGSSQATSGWQRWATCSGWSGKRKRRTFPTSASHSPRRSPHTR